MIIKELLDKNGSCDRDFIGHLKETGQYAQWTKENPFAVVVADIFCNAGPGKVWHSVHDTYNNIYNLCKSKHWKFIVFGVDPRFSQNWNQIWSEND
jgi:hypothetical protein